MHVMLDLETLGTRPDAAIIQIGAVLFEPVSGGKLLNMHAFNRYVLVQDGTGSIDHSTLCFWLAEKSAGAMGAALADHADHLGTVLSELEDWPMKVMDIPWSSIEGVWADPADFDFPILKSAFAVFGKGVPWDRRVTRCARTLYHTVCGGVKPEIDWIGFTHHNAMDDAVGQAMQVQKAMGMVREVWG